MLSNTTKQRSNTILTLSLPIIGGMLSQTLMNLADAAMVGHLPNADIALNAQGIASQSVWAVSAFLIGIGSAIQTWASRRTGEGKPQQSGHGLSIALLYSLAIGAPLSLLGIFFAEDMMQLLIKTETVIKTATPYFQIRSASWFLVMFNFSFRGFFNGISKPRIYFSVIWLSQIVNIILSLGLIYGFWGMPALGVTGAGIGTTLATLFSTILYFIISSRYKKRFGAFHIPTAISKQKHIFKTLLRLSLPAGLTGILNSAGFLLFLVISDKIGTAQSAASNILIQLASVSFLPAIGFGLAAATLVSKNLGANKPEEAYRWGMDTVKLGSGILGAVGIILFIAPELVIKGFTNNTQIIDQASLIVQILGVGVFFDATGNILSQALIGAGAVKSVLITNVTGMWLVFIPGAWYFGLLQEGGMIGLWIPLFVYRLGHTIVMLKIFKNKNWIHIKA